MTSYANMLDILIESHKLTWSLLKLVFLKLNKKISMCTNVYQQGLLGNQHLYIYSSDPTSLRHLPLEMVLINAKFLDFSHFADINHFYTRYL